MCDMTLSPVLIIIIIIIIVYCYDVFAANICDCRGAAANCESEQSSLAPENPVRLAASWISHDFGLVINLSI